jgi:hypothetical protein
MIDRYDAPEGMVALRMWEDCGECHYFKDVKDTEDDGYCPHFKRCNHANRKDGERACFVTREDFEKMLIKEIEGFYNVRVMKLDIGLIFGNMVLPSGNTVAELVNFIEEIDSPTCSETISFNTTQPAFTTK